MGNCLVTKLKGVVDNDSLLKLDEFVVNVSRTTPNSNVKVNTRNGGGTITLIGDGMLEQNGVQSKSLEYSTGYFKIPAGNYQLKYTNKYEIYILEDIQNPTFMDLKFLDKLETLTMQGVSGDINDCPVPSATFSMGSPKGVYGEIKATTPILCSGKAIGLNESKITGDIKVFAQANVNVPQITIAKSNVTGSIEELIATFIEGGKTEGSITVCMTGVNVTIGGEVHPYAYDNCRLVWSDATHYYYQNGTDASVANPQIRVNIYAKNPTASQIANWEANNNTVIQL